MLAAFKGNQLLRDEVDERGQDKGEVGGGKRNRRNRKGLRNNGWGYLVERGKWNGRER